MRTFTRLSLLASAAVFAQLAHAEINYNIIEASVAFNNGDTSNLTVNQNGGELDFTAGDTALLVGDGAYTGSNHNAAVVTIIYTATSTERINNLELIFSGWASGNAAIGYTEYVEGWNPDTHTSTGELGFVSGARFGAGMGGSDTPFVVTDNISLNNNTGVFSYKVKKTFTLANLDRNPEDSFASLGTIEQNAVPEPATMGALAIGALGLLARRRRK